MGTIPHFQKGLMEQQVAVEKLIVEAYEQEILSKIMASIDSIKNSSKCKVAKQILDDLIEANQE